MVTSIVPVPLTPSPLIKEPAAGVQVPLTVNELFPVARFPLAAIVPLTVKAAPKVVFVEEFMVKLFKPPLMVGKVKLPVAVKFELDPPVRVPLVVEIAFTVKVFDPIDKAPVVRVRVPAMV